MKLVAVTFLVFVVLFIAVRHFQADGSLLYQGIALACFVSVSHYVVARYRAQSIKAATKDAFLSFLFGYAFVFTLSAMTDSSQSVKMIHHLFDAPEGLTRDAVARFYVDDATGTREIDKRLKRQTDGGMITRQDGRYTLTDKGRFLAETFSAVEVLFGCGQ